MFKVISFIGLYIKGLAVNRFYVLVIVAVVLMVYGRIVTHEHVLDDRALIPNQSVLKTPFDLESVLLGRYWGDLRPQDTLYRPFTIWTLALNHWANTLVGLPGEHPVIYRITSVLLHAGVCVLIFVFVRWLGFSNWVGLWAGLLFAVLPIHTEAVASAVNRSEILALGFGLAFLMLYQHRWLLAGLFLFLALLSKESAILFVFVALWHVVVVRKDVGRFLIWPWVGYACVALVWWWLRQSAIGDALQAVVMLDNPVVMVSAAERVFTALAVQGCYVFLQIIPLGLSADYSYAQIPVVYSVWYVGVLGFVGVLIGAGYWAWRVRFIHPFVPFLLGSYVLLFGLTSNLVFPIGTIMGERLAYAPSMCLCVLAGWGLTRLPVVWMWRLGFVVVVIYGGVALARLGVWQNADIFYTTQVMDAPQSAKAHYAVAHEVYQPAGAWDEAAQHYARAVEILPNYPDAWNNLGVIKKDVGDLAGAIAAYEMALKWHNAHLPARVNLGQAYQSLGETKQAMRAYGLALQSDSTHAIAGNNLAVLYAQQGNVLEARALFERVLRHHPTYASAQKNYQMFLEMLHKP